MDMNIWKMKSQKAMEASNVNRNVAKWKIDPTLLGKPEESEDHVHKNGKCKFKNNYGEIFILTLQKIETKMKNPS